MENRDEKISRLIDILSIPTYFGEEDRLINKITSILDNRGYSYYVDDIGNVYVTKGEAEYYPCVVAHTDTVHRIVDYSVIRTDDGSKLYAVDKKNKLPTGIGGDDKAGVFICLELLDKIDVIKAAFFVSEEFGCIGSRLSDPKFFDNVGYAIQFDAPFHNWLSYTSDGVRLFDQNGEFFSLCEPIFKRHFGEFKMGLHPYTDVSVLKRLYDFSCINYSVGYYNMHNKNEFVDIEVCFNAETIALELIDALGNKKYEYVDNNIDPERERAFNKSLLANKLFNMKKG